MFEGAGVSTNDRIANWETNIMTISKRAVPAIAALTLAGSIFAMTPVFAAGGESGSTTVPSCAKGKVWDRKKKRCVKANKS